MRSLVLLILRRCSGPAVVAAISRSTPDGGQKEQDPTERIKRRGACSGDSGRFQPIPDRPAQARHSLTISTRHTRFPHITICPFYNRVSGLELLFNFIDDLLGESVVEHGMDGADPKMLARIRDCVATVDAPVEELRHVAA